MLLFENFTFPMVLLLAGLAFHVSVTRLPPREYTLARLALFVLDIRWAGCSLFQPLLHVEAVANVSCKIVRFVLFTVGT